MVNDRISEERLSYRPREAARVLGVSERTLFSLVKSGAIRAVKLSAAKQGAVLIPRAELEQFLCDRAAGKREAVA